jgi:hypothetical protein
MPINFGKNWIVAIATSFIYCVSFIFITTLTTEAQKITGRVLDSKTTEALPFANVFLNNTTIGTVTDINGEFALSTIKEPGSYESYKMKVNLTQELRNIGVIKLIPLELQLDNVEVSSNRDKEWEKQLKKFRKIFLGEDKEASACTIVNPWVIDFPSHNSSGAFTAKASAPIEIDNRALGYKIVFYLSNFWSNKGGYIIAGNARFSEMKSNDPKEIAKWQVNRKNSYAHSPHHLFKSIIQSRIKAEGFNLYAEAKGYENATQRSSSFYSELGKTVMPYDTNSIVIPDTQNGYKILLKGRVEIHYDKHRALVPIYDDVKGPVSWITIGKDYVLVNKDGFIKNPSDIVVSGDMSMDRVSRMLPLDYRPEPAIEKERVNDLSFYQEQIYVHTDKPYYYPGETVWFKGYMNYHMPAWRDSLSHTAYVELVDRANRKIILSKTVRIDSGFFYNDLILPDSIKSGNYYLRAYTNLNRIFGDKNLYTKLIPILNVNEKVDSQTTKLVMSDQNNSDENPFTIGSQKKIFKPREKIILTLNLKDDEDKPMASNFSISVTDVTQVVPLDIAGTILNNHRMLDIEMNDYNRNPQFFIEHGINFSGHFINEGKKGAQTMLNIVQLDQPNFAMTQSNNTGFFAVNGLVFYDTAQFYIRPLSPKGKVEGRIEINKREAASIEFDEVNYTLDKSKRELPNRVILENELMKNTRMLQEVEIKATKVNTEKSIDRIKRPYGRPDYVLTRKDLNATSGNLFQTLPGKVPGLVVRQASSNGGELRWVVYIAKGGNSSSILNVREVLVTINDVVATGSPEQILSSIDPSTVESIEVKTGVNVLYGSAGGDGVVSIYTKKDMQEEIVKNTKGVTPTKVLGYSKPRKFNYPDYNRLEIDKTRADYRSTIYWNPEVKTNSATGSAVVSFFAADLPSRYQIVAEGVTQKGEPIKCVYFIEVSDNNK